MACCRVSNSGESLALIRAYLADQGRVNDPVAATFRPKGGQHYLRIIMAIDRSGLRQMPGLHYLAARDLFFDDVVQQAVGAGISQLLILGAGFDTRAWRFASSGFTVIEVDREGVQAQKRRLAPPNGPTYVPADLAREPIGQALLGAGLVRDEPSVIIAEGLAMYLTLPALRALLGTLAGLAAPGSRLALDLASGPSDDRHRSLAASALTRFLYWAKRSPIRSHLGPDQAGACLAPLGWALDEQITATELVSRYVAAARPLSPGHFGAYTITAHPSRM